MADQSHFREILRGLLDEGVEFLVIGGYAVMHYTEPRYTKDLDLWVRTTVDNSVALYRALAAFGAPLKDDGVDPMTFIDPGIVYQIGAAPIRVDFTTQIDGVDFNLAWSHKIQVNLFGVPVYMISIADLIQNKEAAARPNDQIDVDALKKHQKPVDE